MLNSFKIAAQYFLKYNKPTQSMRLKILVREQVLLGLQVLARLASLMARCRLN